MKEIAIYGAGGHGREVAWLVQSCNRDEGVYQVVCFVDDNEAKHGAVLNGIPVMSLEVASQRFPGASVVGGVGTPKIRERLVQKAAAVGFEFASIIHPSVELSPWVEIGPGTVICANCVLTTNITLGRHVQINVDCTIHHDVIMGDYATLGPGVHVSGCVHLGKRSRVGVGAVIINGTPEKPLVIGDDVMVGGGACVTRSIAPGLTVVGVPAKPIR